MSIPIPTKLMLSYHPPALWGYHWAAAILQHTKHCTGQNHMLGQIYLVTERVMLLSGPFQATICLHLIDTNAAAVTISRTLHSIWGNTWLQTQWAEELYWPKATLSQTLVSASGNIRHASAFRIQKPHLNYAHQQCKCVGSKWSITTGPLAVLYS